MHDASGIHRAIFRQMVHRLTNFAVATVGIYTTALVLGAFRSQVALVGQCLFWSHDKPCWYKYNKWQKVAHRQHGENACIGTGCAPCSRIGNKYQQCLCLEHRPPHAGGSLWLSEIVRDTQSISWTSAFLQHVLHGGKLDVGRDLRKNNMHIPRRGRVERAASFVPSGRLPEAPRAPLALDTSFSIFLESFNNFARTSSDLAFLALRRRSLERFNNFLGSS